MTDPMTDQGDNQDLDAIFRAARARDTAWTPGFHRVLNRRPTPRRRPWLLGVGALVAASALVAVVMVRARTHRDAVAPFTITVGSLRMPTDFLLDIAGAETLRSVPSIGRSDDWFPNLSGSKGHPL